MIYRIAKPSDLMQISDLFYKVRDTYSVGYFAKMGKLFIREYYRTILNDPYEVIVCAEDENGKIRGFSSGTIDVKKQFERMRRYKWRFALSAIPTFVLHPSMLKETLSRYKSTEGDESEKYIPREGARSEYWLWDASHGDPASSVDLYETFNKTMFSLGVKRAYFEVDDVNKKVMKFHKINGAVEYAHITMPDGRNRTLFYIDYSDKYIN